MKHFLVFGATLLALVATVGTANAQLNLVPNGDFEAGGADWVFAAVGAEVSYPATGGNTGGYGQIDQTAANWGGVLVSEDAGLGLSLGSLGLVAGTSYTFSVDMIDLNPGTGGTAGMKIENWDDGTAGNIGDSGDVVFAITDSWDTYTFDFLVDANSVGLKFVPLMVGQPVGASVGFDNVGVIVSAVPEPGSLGLIALGMVGLVARRRRS